MKEADLRRARVGMGPECVGGLACTGCKEVSALHTEEFGIHPTGSGKAIKKLLSQELIGSDLCFGKINWQHLGAEKVPDCGEAGILTEQGLQPDD